MKPLKALIVPGSEEDRLATERSLEAVSLARIRLRREKDGATFDHWYAPITEWSISPSTGFVSIEFSQYGLELFGDDQAFNENLGRDLLNKIAKFIARPPASVTFLGHEFQVQVQN